FLPINQDNVSNAATLYSQIFCEWSYSSAYARLSSEAKSVGFDGYIAINDSGLPCGFIMGHNQTRADGNIAFYLLEMCFESNEIGRCAAKESLAHLMSELRCRNISIINTFIPYSPNADEFFTELGFNKVDNIISMQKSIE
ncbi:MAG: hypothetical protein RSA70_08010, partial [Clostridia bacterium]